MNTLTEIRAGDIAELDVHLLVAAVKALQELAWAADGDIYTDAPECQVSVNSVQDTIQQAHEVLAQIRQALEPKSIENTEVLANRILDEAEEAFAARSMAEELALDGKWQSPVLVQDYLFWIEDEAQVQAKRPVQPEESAEQRIYVQALQELSLELRQLGFSPSHVPWQVQARSGGDEP